MTTQEKKEHKYIYENERKICVDCGRLADGNKCPDGGIHEEQKIPEPKAVNNVSEKKEAVRQFIVRTVSSVMDLKMGCIVKTNEKLWEYCMVVRPPEEHDIMLAYQYDENGIYSDCHFSRSQIVEIIGRPITLADVLVATRKTIHEVTFNYDSEDNFILRCQFIELPEGMPQYCIWNPLHDFDHQSEEVWLFLYGLFYE